MPSRTGNLRDLAEADRKAQVAEREQADQANQQRYTDEVRKAKRPAAEWLGRFLFDDPAAVNPDALSESRYVGTHVEWRVTVDGFKLAVRRNQSGVFMLFKITRDEAPTIASPVARQAKMHQVRRLGDLVA